MRRWRRMASPDLRCLRSMATLLGTLRPAGVLGDANDVTFESFFGFNGSLTFSRVALEDFTAGGSVEFVVFKMRGQWSVEEQGPGNPEWYIEWYEGPTGAGLSAGPFVIPGGPFSPFTFASENQTTDRQGQPWSVPVLNSLEMRGYANVNDGGGSQIQTQVDDIDVWAEVWGEPAPPPPPVFDREVETITLGCEGAAETLACDGTLAITLLCDADEEV